MDFRGDVPPDLLTMLYDPQTSGGLFLSMPEDRVRPLLLELKDARAVGRVTAENQGRILILA